MNEGVFFGDSSRRALSRRQLLKLLAASSGGVALSGLISACTAPSTPPPTTAPGPTKSAATTQSTFIFGRGGDSAKLDPIVTIDGEVGRVTRQIFDGLVRFDGQTTKVSPALAEKWDVSADGKVWTFRIRQNIKFHDGTPLDADAVVFNFQRWMDATNPYHMGGDFTYWGSMFSGFKNDPKTEQSLLVQDVKATDPSTVQITLKTPMAPFIADLTIYAFGISSPTAVKKDVANYFKNPVGTGPFKFVEWVPGDRVTLAANPDYWGTKPQLDRLAFRVIKDNTARFLELKAGTIHGMEGLNPDDIATAKADSNLKILMRPSLNVGYIAFNFNSPTVGKKEVRQAIAYGTNRQAIVDALYAGTGEVASQNVPPAVWGHNPDLKPYPYDPAKAKDLLKSVGLDQGFAIDLYYMPVSRPYFPDPKPVAEALAADLAKVGITANLKTVDWGEYTTDWRKGNFESWMLGWSSDTGDPDEFLFTFWGRDSVDNFWKNTQVMDMLQKARTAIDQAQREKLYEDVAVLTYDELPRVPIVHTQVPLAFRSNVQGYLPHPASQEIFNTVYFK